MNLTFPFLPIRLGRLWGLQGRGGLTLMANTQGGKSQVSKTAGASSATSDECRKSLLEVIESQIIPRLLDAHPVASSRLHYEDTPQYRPTQTELEAFAELCLHGTTDTAIAFVDSLTKRHVSHEDIFLHLIAPAARLLGEGWEEDRVDFAEVTLGLMQLQQITHHLGYEYQDGPQKPGPVRRVMFASAPGSQHVLGLSIVSEFFRKDGWQVVVEIAPSLTELCHAAHNEWFDLIGFSVGLVEQIDTLPDLITRVRQASRNPNTQVLLGGPAFLLKPLQAQSLGAGAICLDPKEGLQMANSLVNQGKQQGAAA